MLVLKVRPVKLQRYRILSLVLAEAIVKTRVGRMLTKLHLRDRVQAVVFAYKHGLVRPGTAP